MGWWRINPKTGKPLPQARSRLSPPGVQMLNAIPGVDDEAQACYCGDAPWDIMSLVAPEIAAFLERYRLEPSLDELMAFVLDGAVPPAFASAGAQPAKALQRRVASAWASIDGIFQDTWGRSPRLIERVAACREYLVPLARRRQPAARDKRDRDKRDKGE